jgi:uncharacterized protein (DUF433 family)
LYRGTRIPIVAIVEMRAEGMTPADIIKDYLQLTEADVAAALELDVVELL